MKKQHTFIEEDFENMLNSARMYGTIFRTTWNLDINDYQGEDTIANKELMKAFMDGVIAKTG